MRSSVAFLALLWLCDQSHAFVAPQTGVSIRKARQQTTSPVFSSKRTSSSSDARYYEEEEEPYEATRYAGDSEDARELQNMRYEPDYEYHNDEPEDEQSYRYQDDEYDDADYYYDDDEVETNDELDVGNYWSNPKEGLDPLPSGRPRQRRRASASPRSSSSRRGPRSRPRTSFRSGAPKSPENVNDFYERLFWYGFDTDENMAVGDKTFFGGTKGKFNGLQIFGESVVEKPKKKRRRDETPQQFRADEWFDDMMYSIDGRDTKAQEEEYPPPRRAPRAEALPPARPRRRRPSVDEDYEQEDYEAEQPMEETRRRPRRRPRDDSSRADWVSKEVSTWFGQNEAEEDDELLYKRAHRRPRGERKSPWSVTGVLDSVFGVSQDERDMNAAAYNRQMGLGPRTPRPTSRERRRRGPGYAYPYDVEEEDEPPVVADIVEPIIEPDVLDALDVEAVQEEEEVTEPNPDKRERTWEERALAVEQVPPSGIPAWGPTGEVGMDARTKATLDALEEIRAATRTVELKEERCIDAKEDLVVLKADVELQKKRLQASKGDPRRIRARIRQMQDEVEYASRALRRAKAEENLARERLAALEDRHWALLSLYDADKAFREVVEAFREFEETERSTSSDGDEKVEYTDGETLDTTADTDTPEETQEDLDSKT